MIAQRFAAEEEIQFEDPDRQEVGLEKLPARHRQSGKASQWGHQAKPSQVTAAGATAIVSRNSKPPVAPKPRAKSLDQSESEVGTSEEEEEDGEDTGEEKDTDEEIDHEVSEEEDDQAYASEVR